MWQPQNDYNVALLSCGSFSDRNNLSVREIVDLPTLAYFDRIFQDFMVRDTERLLTFQAPRQ
jgi:hypothetical protein